jgi:glycosyltransferase involved in cell wall biosynthesis
VDQLQASSIRVRGRKRTRAVHQFHSGSSVGDAITNSMFLIQTMLRDLGYQSEIFVEHRDPRLAEKLFVVDDLPEHDDYVLLVHHSMGHGVLDFILSLDAPKILIYHNVTPPEFLDDAPWVIPYAHLGRQQLSEMRAHMSASLADSEYNMLELRDYGYDDAEVCSLLFDLNTLRPRRTDVCAQQTGTSSDPFTILFVGRVVKSKGQADLVDAFAEFAKRHQEPSRLVLVGRFDSVEDAYPAEIRRRAEAHGLGDRVTLTGGVSDEELHRWFATADAYVSLSHHEGFGVPLIEAMAHGLPVIAWPVSAIAYTIGEAAIPLLERSTEAVADALIRLATNDAYRREVIDRQLAFIGRYELDRHKPALLRALSTAGASVPLPDDTRAGLARNLHTTFVGHVEGAYSLAAVNRSMAMTMEAARPAHQRVVPWENGPGFDSAKLPDAQKDQIAVLISRGRPATEPQIVVSQHYPILIPDLAGRRLAMIFWEESLLPDQMVQTLNDGFEAVLAPTEFVRKALIDSGVWRPIINIGYAPDLTHYRNIGIERSSITPQRPFTLLHVSSCFPRKGVDLLLAAFARAFRRDDNVELIIKTFANPHNTVIQQVADLRAKHPDIGPIRVIEQDYNDDEMLALFRQCDAMVLPTRGEGFNLPAAEAMAARMPLITTGYGGHLDFTAPDNCRFIDFRFVPSESHVTQGSSLWVEPDVEDLTKALQELHRDRLDDASPSNRKAQRATDDIAEALAPAPFVDRLVQGAVDLISGITNEDVRVGWVSTWDVKCGVAEYSRFLLSDLQDRQTADQLTVTILCDDRTDESTRSELGGVVKTWTLMNDQKVMSRLARGIAVNDPHIVVIQHQPGLIAWSHLAHLLQDTRLKVRKTVVVLHSVPTLAQLSEGERHTVIAALRGVTRVLVHQVSDLNRLKDYGLVANVTHFPHGAPPRFKARDARPLSDADAPVIGSYGFFLPGKGISKLIRALPHLRQEWPRVKLRLVNAQYDSPVSADEIARCKALAESIGVDDMIDWHTDFQADNNSLALLADCDLLVLPYDESNESASGAVRIALASGAPVSVTPAAIFDELGEAVFRFSGFEQDSINQGIGRLLQDQQTRRQKQDDAAAWLSQRQWPALARRMNGLLRGLHASRERRKH